MKTIKTLVAIIGMVASLATSQTNAQVSTVDPGQTISVTPPTGTLRLCVFGGKGNFQARPTQLEFPEPGQGGSLPLCTYNPGIIGSNSALRAGLLATNSTRPTKIWVAWAAAKLRFPSLRENNPQKLITIPRVAKSNFAGFFYL